MNDSERVREFTEGSTGKPCPERPVALSREKAMWILRMVFSELDELACTVTSDPEARDEFMRQALETRDRCKNFTYPDEHHVISAQADAFVDAWYYMLNTGCQHGMNLSRLFNVIHEANMAKRDPATGEFIRRPSDGKVMKPAGWQAPDVEGEMAKQMEHGSWNAQQSK